MAFPPKMATLETQKTYVTKANRKGPITVNILLIKPQYYSPYPPLGLLKFATYYRDKGHHIEFMPIGYRHPRKEPDLILVTSLWTWAWWPVHKTIKIAKMNHKSAKIILGGVYASLMPQHAARLGVDEIVTGLDHRVENLTPDYSLVPTWNGEPWKTSIVFTSRGCTRKCDFCAVPTLEGGITSKSRKIIENQIHPDHDWIHVQDNNILAQSNWKEALEILADHNKKMDFTGGIDLRIVNDEQARMIADMRIRSIKAGFDNLIQHRSIHRGIQTFERAGQRARDIVLYELFNYKDKPYDLFKRMKLACKWKAVSYPMRYQPIKGIMALKKDVYIGKHWNEELLEVVARGRRILGTHGAFPPTNTLRKRLETTNEMRKLLKIDSIKGIVQNDPDQTSLAEFINI